MRNHEEEEATYSCRAGASSASAESLLGRLNQIDLRLRQLEEKERPRESCFNRNLRARIKPPPPTIDDAHLKHTLMDRLQLLETKIRQVPSASNETITGSQLSNELHQGSDTSYRAIPSPSVNQKQKISNNSSIRMVGGKVGQASADMFESQSSKKACCTLTPRIVLRWMRSCIFCTGDDHCCLNPSSTDDCESETQGIHASCYH